VIDVEAVDYISNEDLEEEERMEVEKMVKKQIKSGAGKDYESIVNRNMILS
jgi:hypothetical protein